MSTAAHITPAAAGALPDGGEKRRRRLGQERINWWATAFIAVASLTVLVPLYLGVVVALKTPEQLLNSSGFEWPTEVRLENFSDAWTAAQFPTAVANTGLITVLTLLFTIFTSSIVSWAIARNMDKLFFKAAFFYFLSAMFIPFPIIMLPLVQQTALLGLDNKWGMIILYTVFGISTNVFIYTAYVRSIPIELEEAARMDGASTWGVFWKVIFPLLSPMNATVGILTCVWAWNDYIMPLVVLTNPADRTLVLSQSIFQGQFNIDHTVSFASYLMAMAPLLLVYIFAQRWVISGVTRGSIK
ncbi:carbohydrate ABC transporter permease [Tessaracoccus caeni]|uniref:carbohydrate ABC transporter permease n=1 Tax=Tessaracoccus caeni TaxID=3031239 RepID=UPI0023D97D1A|nr:carbohydrate ABC transporter permease [Tessaracoccus caeni]MDF1490182.1 carbohydrate ABC transporter permease [Tessaracoccus caeni]